MISSRICSLSLCCDLSPDVAASMPKSSIIWELERAQNRMAIQFLYEHSIIDVRTNKGFKTFNFEDLGRKGQCNQSQAQIG